MRILIAPDAFDGTLTAVRAAEAIAAGWARRAPGDRLDLAPMSDGGPGLVDVLHAGLGGDLVAATVRGPFGDRVPATVLLVDRERRTAYVEAAQACGRHLLGGRQPDAATSYGVGELVALAVDAGATGVVVGLGGCGALDGGAGLLAALGATADRPLDAGAGGLAGIGRLDAGPARRALEGVTLVAAGEGDGPLTGMFGAVRASGPALGVAEERVAVLDRLLEEYAAVAGRRLALDKGAGAAGGLGYALMLLGARRRSGTGLVADVLGLGERAGEADLVVTGEGAFDFASRAGTVPHDVAQLAGEALRPCVVLAGRVDVGAREMRALGVESAYSMASVVGADAALADPGRALERLAERVARTWSP